MVREKSAPLQHTERLLSLVPFITANQGISLKDLAEVFKVSTSQMSADLTTLWMCGLPGYTALELMDLSFDSGYVTIRNAQTLENPRTLNFDEIVALLIGLDLLKDSLAYDSTLNSAISSLTQRLAQKSGISSRLRATSDVSSSLRADIQNALNLKRVLNITYHSLYSDAVTERIVLPLEFRIEEGIEYLFAYCQSAQAFRVFRLDRILELRSVPGTQIPEFNTSNNQTRSIEFAIKVNDRLRLMSERFSLDVAVTDDLYQSQSFSEQWIIRSIFGSSGSVELVNPGDLRSQIGQKAQLMLDRYLTN